MQDLPEAITYDGETTMKLLTQAILKATPPLYANDGKKPEDVPIRAKFFTPDSSWTWFMTELDPVQGLAFGYARNAEMPDCAELGYFSLPELESMRGPLGLTIERDLHYGQHTLAEVMPAPLTEIEKMENTYSTEVPRSQCDNCGLHVYVDTRFHTCTNCGVTFEVGRT